MAALWGGRFTQESDPRFKAFNDSLSFDYRLAVQDVDGSQAWAEALVAAGVLSAAEGASLKTALAELRAEVSAAPAKAAQAGDEDIHSYIERRLIEKLGPLGKKLHTGRSRNDQVALDLKLWCREACTERKGDLLTLEHALLDCARRHEGAPFPGYTHLQRAQPVTFTHYLLAYAQMFERDLKRLNNARELMDTCPLGAAALAGTAYPVDREKLAVRLGFKAPTANSLDAVSDRDHVLELLAVAAVSMVHLSRLCEDLIIYNSGEARFIELSDAVTSGSSLMPQKKNPDALELIRGKCGRVSGALCGMLMTCKGLPLAYDKDLQEDKERLFDALDTWGDCLNMAAVVLEGLTLNRERALAAAVGGYANATDLADYLVGKGVPFREAHELAGRAVLLALKAGVSLEELDGTQWARISPLIGADVREHLKLERLLEARDVTGGTAPAQSARELEALEKRLKEYESA